MSFTQKIIIIEDQLPTDLDGPEFEKIRSIIESLLIPSDASSTGPIDKDPLEESKDIKTDGTPKDLSAPEIDGCLFIKWLISSDPSTNLIVKLNIKGDKPIKPNDIEAIAQLFKKFKEETPELKVVLSFDQAIFEQNALIGLLKLIEDGHCPNGMTINFSNFSYLSILSYFFQIEWDQISSAFIRAFIRSSSKHLHLIISEYMFEILSVGFYNLLKYSQCLESLHVKAPSQGSRDYGRRDKLSTLKKYEITNALRGNAHILSLEIDKCYYDTLARPPPRSDFFSSFVPDFFSEEDKQEGDVTDLISRNRNFNSIRKTWITDFFQTLAFPKALANLIEEYNPLLSSPLEDEQMSATALHQFTSLKAIRQDGFETFCNIYLEYRIACQEAFKKNQKFSIVLRQYMRPFFAALHKASLVKGAVEFSKEFIDDLVFFIQLAKITPAELERQIVFLEAVPPQDIHKLREACIDKEKVDTLDLIISPECDFKAILDLRPGSIIRLMDFDQKSMYFDKNLSARFCHVLADKKCPQDLTIIISKAISHLDLVRALTEVVRKGSYPKGTCLIYKKEDHFNLGYADLFSVLAEKSPIDKPELHLILPICSDSPLYRSGTTQNEKRINLIVHNKFLKTLVFSKYLYSNDVFEDNEICIVPQLINALKINDTLTTFDINIDIRHSIECTFWGLRNQQFFSDQYAVSYYCAPMILNQELKAMAREGPIKIDPAFAAILCLAIDRHRDNLKVLFNWTFLKFFKKNIVQIMEQLWLIICKRHYLLDDQYDDFNQLIRALLPAAQITAEDIDQDKTQADIVRQHLLAGPLSKKTEQSPSSQPSVLLEDHSAPLFKNLDLVRASVMFYFGANENNLLIEYATKNQPHLFQQKIREHFSNGRLTLSAALQLSFLINELKDTVPLTQLDTEIKQYDENKGRFRQFFNSSTQTVNDLRSVAKEIRKQNGHKISAFQIELCLMARDQRNSYFNFRPGIICRSVAFFKSGEIAGSRKKSCQYKMEANLSQTEKLIKRLSGNLNLL